MFKLPAINGRDIIPIRLISFITERKIEPLKLVRFLAQLPGATLRFPFEWTDSDRLYTYYFRDPLHERMPPNAWDYLVQDLSRYYDRNKANLWRAACEYDAVMMLPAGVFVWRDEFESVYYFSLEAESPSYRGEYLRPGELDLNYRPFIGKEYGENAEKLFEGFEPLILTDVYGIDKEKLSEKDDLSTELISKSFNLPDRKGKKVPEEKRRRKEDFTVVMEQAFKKSLEEGNTEILQPRNIVVFLKFLKRLAESEVKMEDGKRTYAELIRSVKPSSTDECLLMQKPRTVRGKKDKENRWYTQKDVTRKLSELRKEHREITKNNSSTEENNLPTN